MRGSKHGEIRGSRKWPHTPNGDVPFGTRRKDAKIFIREELDGKKNQSLSSDDDTPIAETYEEHRLLETSIETWNPQTLCRGFALCSNTNTTPNVGRA